MSGEWQTVGRPGYSGSKKAELRARWDSLYGAGNWRIAWVWGEQVVDKSEACQIYERGYLEDSFRRPEVWRELAQIAREVWDIEERDVESGLDYNIQKGAATHLQDIAIRNVFAKREWKFEGTQLIQIRGHNTYWGRLLSPGKVPFHLPAMIVQDPLQSKEWWDADTIEAFYQRNKVLQSRQ